MNNISNYIIDSTEQLNERLDSFLASKLEKLSRSKIKSLILTGCVMCGDQKALDPSAKVAIGQYKIFIPPVDNSGIKARDIPLNIIYEDDDLVVINKQSGLTVHPGAGNYDDTLVNALVSHFGKNLSKLNGDDKAGIVHRLDRDTTGLMVIAKNDFSHMRLSEQLQDRTLSRQYLAICYGMPAQAEGKIHTHIDRAKSDRTKMTVTKSSGREAITNYKLLEVFQKAAASMVRCSLETGRTHQIRVHLSHIGHSIIGDQTYGKNQRKAEKFFTPQINDFIKRFNRQALHSYRIAFIHPNSGQKMEFEVDPPTDMTRLINLLRG
jgi:23S rRNA pseudouridine1911/1915/1917 synthase